MENVKELAELAAVMALSLPLALGLVWLGLLSAFQLLPRPPRHVAPARPAHDILGGLRWAVAHSKGLSRASRVGLDG